MLQRQTTTATAFKSLVFISQVLLSMTIVLLLQAEPGQGTIIEDAAIEKEIVEKYPGLFYTEEEVKDYVLELKKLELGIIDREIHWTELVTYSGCCASNSSLRYFSVLPDRKGRNVTLVQFLGKKQWIQVDTCRTVGNCYYCTCALENRYFTALVYNPDFPNNSSNQYILDLVYAPLVCKCFNNLTGPQCDKDSSSRSAAKLVYLVKTGLNLALRDVCLAP